jgi:RNA polymerase sigma-70 factor (family 1)
MSANNSNGDVEILRELAEGSESAFLTLFNEYSPRVYRSALKFLGTEEAAQEVVQDVFLDIWLNRAKMPRVLNFTAYLHGMVRNQVYDAFRKKSAFSSLVNELKYSDYAENSTERMFRDREYETIVDQTIGNLPKLQREIFLLAREEGLSHKEIAHRTGLSTMAVKAHMKRILHSMRIRLEPFLAIEPLLALFAFWNSL